MSIEKGVEVDWSVQDLANNVTMIAGDNITQILGIALIQNYHSLAGSILEILEANSQTKMVKKGKIKKTKLNITGNTADQIVTLTIRKNGVATDLVFTIPAANSVDQELTTILDFAENDLLSIEISAAIGTGVLNYNLSFEVELER